MINNDDIEKAKKNIEDLLKLRDDLIKSSPKFNEMKSRLNWYQEAGTQIPEQTQNLYSLIERPVIGILTLSPSNLDFSSITDSTASFYTVTGDTRNVIIQYGNVHNDLIQSFDELNKTESLMDEIAEIIESFRDDLKTYKPKELLLEAKEAYAKWKAGVIDNYELAAGIRAFQDIFNGSLSKAWVNAFYKEIPKKYPEFNWNKMSETLGKNGGGCKNSLRTIKGTDDRLHLFFTEVLKKTKDVERTEMDLKFKEYIEHIYAILNFIDIQQMK